MEPAQPFLFVFEDTTPASEDEKQDEEGEEEVYASNFILNTAEDKPARGPRRGQRFPTEFRNPVTAVTLEERRLLNHAAHNNSKKSSRDRPAGPMPTKGKRRNLDELFSAQGGDLSAVQNGQEHHRQQSSRKKQRRNLDDMSSAEDGGAWEVKPAYQAVQVRPSSVNHKAERGTADDAQKGLIVRRKLDPWAQAAQAREENRQKRAFAAIGAWARRKPGEPQNEDSREQQGEELVTLPAGFNSAHLSQLHQEIERFTAAASPSMEERAGVDACLMAIREVTSEIWPHSSTQMFGSQAVGLAMKGSDIDIVVLGVVSDITSTSVNPKNHKARIMRYLDELRKQLRRNLIDRKQPVNVINAKVPIIKCAIKPSPQSKSWKTDISLGADNGVKAVAWIKSHMQAMAPLRPLVLVIKSLLREKKLHEVHTGGLSSYSLVNMVIAHLLCEGYTLENEGRDSDLCKDFGHLLWGFLTRYGLTFDYHDKAISIRQGGVIDKKSQWRVRFKAYLLAVEDPIQPGKDVASGSGNIQSVKNLFAKSAEQMTVALQSHPTDEDIDEALMWERVQADAQNQSVQSRSYPLLSSILNVNKALQL